MFDEYLCISSFFAGGIKVVPIVKIKALPKSVIENYMVNVTETDEEESASSETDMAIKPEDVEPTEGRVLYLTMYYFSIAGCCATGIWNFYVDNGIYITRIVFVSPLICSFPRFF